MAWTVWTSVRLPATDNGGAVDTGVVPPADGTWGLAGHSRVGVWSQTCWGQDEEDGWSQSCWGQGVEVGWSPDTVTLPYERGCGLPGGVW